MTPLFDRQHDAFDYPATMTCRTGNLRALREADYPTPCRTGRIMESAGRRFSSNTHTFRDPAMSEAVQEILQRIQELPEEDRLVLEERLEELAEAAWKREAEEARRLALEKGIDQPAIDRAIENTRYRS